MKCVYVVALFGFVAIQLCRAAPAPEENKEVVASEATPEAPKPVVEHVEHVEVSSDPVNTAPTTDVKEAAVKEEKAS